MTETKSENTALFEIIYMVGQTCTIIEIITLVKLSFRLFLKYCENLI